MHEASNPRHLQLKDLAGRALPAADEKLVRALLNRVGLSIPVQGNGNVLEGRIWTREDFAWVKSRLADPDDAIQIHLAVECEILRSGQPKRVTGYQAVRAKVICESVVIILDNFGTLYFTLDCWRQAHYLRSKCLL